MVYVFLLCLGFLILPSCFAEKEQTKKEFSLLVINILDENLYQDCHIAGSIHVPFDQLELYMKDKDHGAEIVLYCSNYACGASAYAVKMLQKLGFEHVYAYEGGMAEWYQKGLPVEGPCEQSYLSYVIHQEENSAEIPTINVYTLAQKMGFDMHKEQLAA